MRHQLAFSSLFVALALAICCGGWVLGQRTGLALAAVMSAPLFGIAFAPLVSSLMGSSVRAAREIAYRDIEGRHFEYKGKALRVHDDLAGERWVRVKDVRKVVAGLPKDAVLMRIAAGDIGTIEARGDLFLRAEALDRYLLRNHEDSALRFRHWLQKEVIFPARRAVQLGLARTATREPPPPAAH